MTDDVARGRWYPDMPPALPGETDDQYTNRLTGADRTGRVPYDHRRFRQCSIGWHNECSDPAGEECKCPCHGGAPPASAVTDWEIIQALQIAAAKGYWFNAWDDDTEAREQLAVIRRVLGVEEAPDEPGRTTP